VRLPRGVGHVQAGERPAVIVQHERHAPLLPTLLIIPFTSQLRTTRFPGTRIVHPDGKNGLQVPSDALGFQLTVLDRRHVLHRLGELDAFTLGEILLLYDEVTH
jgi:mRNA-degrading endonuclease toxin of MazEF toxin-antitoxin module